jgi:Predicted Zn-dependent hydrolases of the beta-lactamase fold
MRNRLFVRIRKTLLRRRIPALLLVAVLALSVSGCGRSADSAGEEKQDKNSKVTVTVTPAGTGEPRGTGDPTGTVTPAGGAGVASKGTKPVDALPVHRVSNVANAADGELVFTWLGHSSFLLQMGERNILCDPVYAQLISPVGVVGLSRFSELPMSAEDTPHIDILFLSHDHYDHMDRDTILAIDGRVDHYVVPNGTDGILTGWGIAADKISALNPWESATVAGITFTMTPAQHSGGRMLTQKTLCGGVYIKDGAHTVFYTGDGGYAEHFPQIGERLGAVDLLIAECGQYSPSWSKVHMFPEQTAQVAADVHAEWFIPVHWGAYVLSTHAWDDSVTRCSVAAAQLGLRMATPEIGQTVNYEEIGAYTTHWWEAYR